MHIPYLIGKLSFDGALRNSVYASVDLREIKSSSGDILAKASAVMIQKDSA